MIAYRYLFLLLALPYAALYSMDNALVGSAHTGYSFSNASFAQPECPNLIASKHNAVANRKPAGALQIAKMNEPQWVIQDRPCMPWQPALQSVELGNVQAVKDHFSAWKYMLLPWHYYRQGIANALEHAAQLPAQTTSTVVEYLLEKVDFAHIEDINTLAHNAEQNGHTLILKRLCAHLHATKQCCIEDAPINVSSKQALHIAAAQRDYDACVQQLLSWSGPLEEDAYWPTEAMATFEDCKQTDLILDSTRPECTNAIARISANTGQLGALMKERTRLIQEQKQAKDSEGNTAYDIARAAGANKKLLALLDPRNNDQISSLLLKAIDLQMGNPTYVQKPPIVVQLPASKKKNTDPNGPEFQVGEEVIINGVRYAVKKIAKVKGKKLKYLKTY